MSPSRSSSARKRGPTRPERAGPKTTAVPNGAVPNAAIPNAAVPNAGATGTELALGSPDLRVAALLREREQLLRKIAAKDRERGRLQHASEELSRTLRSELPPIFERQQQISSDLKKLFEEILTRQLSRSARRGVRAVFDSLRRSGFIADALDDDSDDEVEAAFREAQNNARARADEDEREHHSASHGGSWAHSHGAGKSPDAAASGDALRSSFRRIAAALHPDRVQSEAEKRARTELMKELTHAYETGDLARLLQIEERWLASAHADGTTDTESGPASGPTSIGAWNVERQRGLERVVADLGLQLRALLTEIRSLRRDSPLADLTGVRPRSRAHQTELLTEFVERAGAELQMAEGMLSFVRQFAVGEISLAQFMAGPTGARRAEPDADDLLDALMNDMLDSQRHAPRRGRRSPR